MTIKNGNGVGRWQLWVSGLTVLGGAVVGIITYTNQIATLSSKIDASTDRYNAQNLRLIEISKIESENQALLAALQQKLIEVETQFCEAGNIANLTHASDLRHFSLLWQKSYPGTVFPTDNAFYPVVCKRSGGDG